MLDKLTITMMSGPRDGESLSFAVTNPTSRSPMVLTIGRREGSDIRINYDSQVSRLHAHIGFTGEEFWIEDMGSRNGTFVYDERVKEGDRISVPPGTLFRVGRTWLRLDALPNDITAAAEPFAVIDEEEDDSEEE